MMTKKIYKLILVLLACCVGGLAFAKLPTPPADPAKAEEAKKKAADAAKKAGELLGKAQDRAVANHNKNKGMGSVAKK